MEQYKQYVQSKIARTPRPPKHLFFTQRIGGGDIAVVVFAVAKDKKVIELGTLWLDARIADSYSGGRDAAIEMEMRHLVAEHFSKASAKKVVFHRCPVPLLAREGHHND